jgi:site-specific recombinase XerD
MSTESLTAQFLQAQSLVATESLTATDPLRKHLISFLFRCKLKRLAKSTIQNYAYFAGSFVLFAEKNNIVRLCDVKKMTVQLFMVQIEETNSGTSCKDYYKHIKRFFNWLVWEDIIEVNPMAKIEVPREDTKIVQPLQADQLKLLLSACNPKFEMGLRNRALIRVFYETAGRLREISEMKVEDIDTDQEVIKVRGKGDRERLVTISNKTLECIADYLQKRKVKSKYLWLSEHNTPLTEDGIYQIIHKLAIRLSIKNVRCSPHTFRHTRATDLLEEGVQQKYVQELLGHRDPRMTQRYLASLGNKEALKAIKNLGNKSKLD